MALIITTLISSITTLVVTLITNHKSELKKAIDTLIKELEKTRQELEELKKASAAADEVQQRALMRLAKDRLNQGYDFFKKQGKISDRAYETYTELWKSYKELGGNTFVDDEHRVLQDLWEKGGTK